MLVTDVRDEIMSPRYRCWHQHIKIGHQHQSVKLGRKSVTNIMYPTYERYMLKFILFIDVDDKVSDIPSW